MCNRDLPKEFLAFGLAPPIAGIVDVFEMIEKEVIQGLR
jgi:hypothetical protein